MSPGCSVPTSSASVASPSSTDHAPARSSPDCRPEGLPTSHPEGLVARAIRPRRRELATGLRVGLMPDTQLVGRTGPYEVEVLVRVLSEDEIEILGQVTLAERVHEPAPRVRVVLYDADATGAVQAVQTDHFGEFNLGRRPSAHYFVAVGGLGEAPSMLIWEGDKR